MKQFSNAAMLLLTVVLGWAGGQEFRGFPRGKLENSGGHLLLKSPGPGLQTPDPSPPHVQSPELKVARSVNFPV